jgi:hypothetical protein
MPPTWFSRQAYPLLVAYCRHTVAARRVAELIEIEEASSAFNLENFEKLLKMQEREGRAVGSLATKMRLSRSSVDDRWQQPTAPSGPRPWQD